MRPWRACAQMPARVRKIGRAMSTRPGKAGAPVDLLAPIEIAECAGKTDRDDVGFVRVGRRGLECRQPAHDLAALMIEPARRGRRVRTEAVLVDDQNRSIHNAVGKPRQRQGLEAGRAAQRQQAVSARGILQEFDDDSSCRRSCCRRPARRHGILPSGFCRRSVSFSSSGSAGVSVTRAGQAERVDRHARLAPERRGRRSSARRSFRLRAH